MRNSIASYKESLSRIAHEVLDSEEAMENGPAYTGAISQQPSRSIPPQRSPRANGTDHSYIDEIARYRADVQKLQASESEIKALSFNYAALLKEKEEQLRDLQKENVLLRKNLESRKDDGSILGEESRRSLSNDNVTPKGNLDRASIKPQRVKSHERSRAGNLALESSASRQNGFDNGSVISLEHEKLLQEVKYLKALQSEHQVELKLLKEQLDNERANASLLKIKLNEEQQLNESSHRELCDLKTDMEKMSESKELQKESDRNLSELRMLQAEVSGVDFGKEQESLKSLKSTVQTLEREKLELTTEKNELEAKLNSFLTSKLEKNDTDGSDFQYSSKNEPNEVKMASKVSELENILKETCKERDKASQELSRLKQHLLDKSN